MWRDVSIPWIWTYNDLAWWSVYAAIGVVLAFMFAAFMQVCVLPGVKRTETRDDVKFYEGFGCFMLVMFWPAMLAIAGGCLLMILVCWAAAKIAGKIGRTR